MGKFIIMLMGMVMFVEIEEVVIVVKEVGGM